MGKSTVDFSRPIRITKIIVFYEIPLVQIINGRRYETVFNSFTTFELGDGKPDHPVQVWKLATFFGAGFIKAINGAAYAAFNTAQKVLLQRLERTFKKDS